MKIINTIKAFFRKEEESVELDLVAAEIKEGRAFLHTKGEEQTTYMVKASDIRILLNEGKSLSKMDIFSILPNRKKPADSNTLSKEKKTQETSKDSTPPATSPAAETSPSAEHQPQSPYFSPEFEKFRKKKFTVSLYPDEYELLITSQKEYGYKRADFLLACVQSAKKTSLEKAHKKIVKSHRDILLEQQELIKSQLAEMEKDNAAV